MSNKIELENYIAHDGSRQFLTLPDDYGWSTLRDHIAALPGAQVTGFLTDWVTEVWIDFQYRGYEFTINTQYGEYWFFVNDPACPEELLYDIAAHCARRRRLYKDPMYRARRRMHWRKLVGALSRAVRGRNRETR